MKLLNHPPSRGPRLLPKVTYVWPAVQVAPFPLHLVGGAVLDEGSPFWKQLEAIQTRPTSDPGRDEADKIWEAGEGEGGEGVDMREARAAFEKRAWFALLTSANISDLLRVDSLAASDLVTGTPRDSDDDRRTPIHHLPARRLTLSLYYPLKEPARVVIDPYLMTVESVRKGNKRVKKVQCMTVGWMLWSVAQAYKQIYDAHQDYGVWGHAISDLSVESLTINRNNAHVDIGS